MLNPAPTSPTTSTPEPDTSTVPQDAATIPSSAMQAPTGKGLESHSGQDHTLSCCISQKATHRDTPVPSKARTPASLTIPAGVLGGEERHACSDQPFVYLSVCFGNNEVVGRLRVHLVSAGTPFPGLHLHACASSALQGRFLWPVVPGAARCAAPLASWSRSKVQNNR